MDDYKSITKQTYNEKSEMYTTYFKERQAFNKREDLQKFLKLLHGERILDIGCGPGFVAKYFQDKGFNVTAIDNAKAMLDHAKHIGVKDAIEVDLEELEFESNTFDGILLSASLHHIPKAKVRDVLGTLHKIAKPGAVISVSVKKGNTEGFRQVKVGAPRYFSLWQKEEFLGYTEEFFDCKDFFEWHREGRLSVLVFTFLNK